MKALSRCLLMARGDVFVLFVCLFSFCQLDSNKNHLRGGNHNLKDISIKLVGRYSTVLKLAL